MKRGESKLASNHFLMCTPQSGPLESSRSYTEKRRGRKETEVARRIKGGNQRSQTDPASNQFAKCPPPSGIHRDSESWVEKRRGREETEAT